MKHLLLLLLCMSLLLCACQADPQPTAPSAVPTTVPTTVPDTTPSLPETTPTTVPTVPETEAPEETTVPPTEAPVLYTHPLTGLPMEAPLAVRPAAVVINNTTAAQPLMGVGSADIVFEHIAEGGGTVTRLLAVFTDLENAGTVGSIRSARTYLLDLARMFNAPIAHCGYSGYAETYIRTTRYPSFNEFTYGQYYYRDQKRLDAGYSREHTLMIEGPDLLRGLLEQGFDMTPEPERNYGLEFAETVDLDGAPANRITMRFFSEYGKSTTMTYDAETGVYYGSQQWNKVQKDFLDGNTGEAVPFKNVLLLNVMIRWAEDAYHVFTDMTGEGTGYYACNGKYVPIKWYRETADDPFTYTYEDGTPLYLAPGKTYVGMLHKNGPAIIVE